MKIITLTLTAWLLIVICGLGTRAGPESELENEQFLVIPMETALQNEDLFFKLKSVWHIHFYFGLTWETAVRQLFIHTVNLRIV